MFNYPGVWPLPYNVILRNDYSPTFNYSIDRSQTQCWQIKLCDYDQVNISSMHNGWVGHQAWSLRGWLSTDPGGSNILPANFGTRRNVHLTYFGNSWTFYILNFNGCILQADTKFWIYKDIPYYFNIQNCSNEKDGYFLKITYEKNGDTFIC
jgi:hypothetical protein